MTTIYRDRRRPTARRALWVLGLALLLIAGGYVARGPLERISHGALSRLWRGSDNTASALGSIPAYFRGIHALTEERDRLQAELEASRAAVLDRNLIYEENLMLKETFGRLAQPNALLAAVLVRPPETPYDTLILDVGEQEQVAVGDRVTAGGTMRIGQIDEVFAHTSRARLYSAPGRSHDAFLRGEVPIRVEGQGGGSLRAEVPHDANAQVGDLVSFPGIEPNFALVVEQVDEGRGDSAATIYLRLSANPFSLKYAEVWRSSYDR